MKLPERLSERIAGQLGDAYADFLRCMEEPPYKGLRLNRRKIAPRDFDRMGAIAAMCDAPDKITGIPGAFYYNDDGPGRSPLHEAGAYYIQEPSAMLPVTLLDIGEEPLKILDLCAAPGGKTTQIADCTDDKGLIVANEITPNRAEILSENIERMGITNTLVISSEPAGLTDRFEEYFDRILVDAPCSGEGMIRKNPEAAALWSPGNVEKCAARQDMILDCAAKMLKGGGRMVYSTCTFSPEEDEGALERFLLAHPEFTVCEGPRRIWPHTAKGEGHFAVALVKSQDKDTCANLRRRQDAFRGDLKHPLRESLGLLYDFMDENLTGQCRIRRLCEDCPDRLVLFGDSIYLVPDVMPDIKGLKVLRAGLKLGCLKKNRFEPDHALSHALSLGDAKRSCTLAVEDEKTFQYLSGMTIGCNKEMKGWTLVCAGPFVLGWGKASGGIIKNHYPKGLRKN